MLYLHYWFAHSGYDARTYGEQANKTTLRRQLREYKNIRRTNMTAGSTNPKAKEIMALLENNLSGLDISDKIANELNNNVIFTSSNQSGIGNYSYQQLGTFGSRVTAGKVSSDALGQQLLTDLERCQSTSQKALDDMINFLSKVYPDAVKYAINQYAETKKSISQSDLLKKVLTSKSEIVTIENSGNFSEAEKTIIQTYARIQSAVDMIPNLGNVNTKNLTYSTSKGIASSGKNIKDNSHLVAVVVGKIGGNLSHLGGFAYEVAATRAAEVAVKEAAGANVEVFSALTGGKSKTAPTYTNAKGGTLSVETVAHIDAELQKMATKVFPNISFNKNDGSFILTDENLLLSFGGSIKKLGQPTNNPTRNKSVKLQDSTSLQILFNNARSKNHDLTKHYIYSLASGREQKINGLGEDYVGGVTLAAAWRSLVDYVVILNFIDFLAGNGSRYNNNALFLINDKIWGIEDILNRVIENPSSILYDGGKQRFRFYNKLKWVSYEKGSKKDSVTDKGYRMSDDPDSYNRTRAKERSAQWETDLNSLFAGTRVTVKLNVALLSLI